jgi:hypothetical protein
VTLKLHADRLPLFRVGADFVAIPRNVDADTLAARARRVPPTEGNQDFYLAVKKSELTRRWFLSAFIEQSFPDGYVNGLADVPLPMRVVTFRVQNDKLFVFDAAEGTAYSDVFDAEVPVEAYPLVHGDGARADLPGADEYIVFDPAAGLNRFGVVSDFIGSQTFENPIRFQIDLTYLQGFRALPDGMQYQLVFTGYGEEPFRHGDEDLNAFQFSGTMTMALRRYAAPADFHTIVDDGQLSRHYFASASHHVRDTGMDDQRIGHIHPGMRPIRWLISAPAGRLHRASPRAVEGIDLVGAVQRGVEGWNDAFGFPVLERAWRRPEPLSPTTTRTRPPWVDWNAELVRGDLGTAVQELKRESGKGVILGPLRPLPTPEGLRASSDVQHEKHH